MSDVPEKYRVLLVDYDAVTRAGIASMLLSGGFRLLWYWCADMLGA